MDTSKPFSKTVKCSCEVLYDPCTKALIRPLRNTEFELICHRNDLPGDDDWELISIAQAAALCGLKAKTLYEWKRLGRLRAEHGVRIVGSRVMIQRAIFRECLNRGEFARCS